MGRDSRSVLDEPARPPDLTLSYGEGPDHVVDLWLPAAAEALVLFLHGGFWRDVWDRRHAAPLAASLSARGFAVATPEYRRTGATSVWSHTFDDVRRAVQTVPRLLADETGVGLSRVVVSGHSAGGHLALWAARHARVPVVALAPVADLATAYALDLGDGAVASLLGGGPRDVPERFAAADPMALLPIGVPVTLVHGELDRQVPVDLSRRFAAAALAAGDQVALRELPGTDHFQVIDPQSSVWPEVVAAVQAAARR